MAMLKRPRRVLMMVPAGAAVDSAIAHLKPHLQPGDILIDGGNTWFLDTERRSRELAADGFTMSARASRAASRARCGAPPSCRAAAGSLGGDRADPAGHRGQGRRRRAVRRLHGARRRRALREDVHNGIEYGDMQLIAEAYDLLSRTLRLPARELSAIFQEWNAGDLRSYLVEITRKCSRARTRRPAGRWSTSSSTKPSRRARAVDEPARVRHRRAHPDDQRRGREPHPVGAEDRARPREPHPARAVAALSRQAGAAGGRRSRRPLRKQGDLLRAGLRPAEDGVG